MPGARGWRRHIHFDFHVLQVLLQRGWGIGAGLGTVLMVAGRLSAPAQGYYYTFASLLALQVFFELGLNFVVTQMAGHEAARLTITREGVIDGDPDSASRLHSLTVLLRRWYLWASPLFALGYSLLAGTPFFSAWAGIARARVGGRVAAAGGVFRRQSIFQPALGDHGRYRPRWSGRPPALVSSRCRFAADVVWFRVRPWAVGRSHRQRHGGADDLDLADAHGRLRIADTTVKSGATLGWRQDIFPLQWKIALSWLSGWFIASAFTPMLFTHQGAVEAGRVGLALRACSLRFPRWA